ncbi:MAG TPA: L-lysine 6-transaminase [Thermoanaerobaculia bacterium]|nr:L-lysine 6-transaminase [Thermoanaerobaculia bacterium]
MSATVTRASRVPANEVHDRLRRHMLVDGFHLVADLDKSRGPWLYDAIRERPVLDLYTSFSTCALGYNHPGLHTPEFRERILPAALNKPANSDLYTPEMAEFVETFVRTLPEELSHHLFFIEGGALAVENALKTAFDWKVRKNLAAGRGERGHKVIHFREAFHGRSGYTMSITNPADPRKTQYFPQFTDWPRISNPKLRFPATGEVLADVERAERQAIGEIEQALAADPHGAACIIVEPIQGEGGDNHFRPEFLRELRRLADEHELLLIFDEIQTGFGTTGTWWCFEQLGVVPDVVCFGKKTQVCGIAATRRVEEIDSVFQVPSRINSTWGGNLVDMMRCQRYVEIIEEEDLLANAQRAGKLLLDGLRRLEERFPGQVTNARGRGLFLAFDLPDHEVRNKVLKAFLGQDVLGLPSGARAIRFRPALVLTPEDAQEGLRRMEQALTAAL